MASPMTAPMTQPPMTVKGSSTPAATRPPAATRSPVAGTKAPMTTRDSKKVTTPRITPAHMALRAMKSAAEVSKLSILILCPRAYGIRPWKGNAAMRRLEGTSARRDPQAALRRLYILPRGVVGRVAALIVEVKRTDPTGTLARTTHAQGARHGAVGVTPAIAAQSISARPEAIGIEPVRAVTVAVAPGRVLGLTEAEVQRAVLAQGQGHRRAEVLVAARADSCADHAVHLAGSGLLPGVSPGFHGRRIRLALADPAGNLLFGRQAVGRRSLKGHGRRGVADRLGQGGGARRRHGARTRARRGRNHALGVAARQQEGGGHEFDQHTHLLPFTITLPSNAAKVRPSLRRALHPRVPGGQARVRRRPRN